MRQFEENTYLLGRVFSLEPISDESSVCSEDDEVYSSLKDFCAQDTIPSDSLLNMKRHVASKISDDPADLTSKLLLESMNELESNTEESEFSLYSFQNKIKHFKDVIQKLRGKLSRDELLLLINQEKQQCHLSPAFEQMFAYLTDGTLDKRRPFDDNSSYLTKPL